MNRKDGKKIKVDALHNILIDLKPRRCDSDVYINEKVDVTELIKYINKHKMDGENRLTLFHAFLAAFAKMFYEKPTLNRFICNRNTYERDDVILAFVAKVAFDEKSEEVMVNIKCDKDDNIFSLRDKISTKVNNIRNKNNTKDGTNNLVNKIGTLPKILRVPITSIYKYIDKIGLLPKSMMNDNVYYSSAMLSNLGNLDIGSIYHNLTNFGTCSIIMTIGVIHKEVIYDKNGKEKVIDVCDFGINCDERISDGYYFATAVKTFEYILKHPKLLEERLDEKIKYEK